MQTFYLQTFYLQAFSPALADAIELPGPGRAVILVGNFATREAFLRAVARVNEAGKGVILRESVSVRMEGTKVAARLSDLPDGVLHVELPSRSSTPDAIAIDAVLARLAPSVD